MKSTMLSFILLLWLGSVAAQANDTTAAGKALQPVSLDSLIQYSKPIILPDSLVHLKNKADFRQLWPDTQNGDLKPGLIAVTVATNWASFYLKRQADDYYSRYKRASDSKSIKRYYNKTEQFDNLATAALIISGSALTIYLYFLFTE